MVDMRKVDQIRSLLGPDWKIDVLNTDGGEVLLWFSRKSFFWEASVQTYTPYPGCETWQMKHSISLDGYGFREYTTTSEQSLANRLNELSEEAHPKRASVK